MSDEIVRQLNDLASENIENEDISSEKKPKGSMQNSSDADDISEEQCAKIDFGSQFKKKGRKRALNV